MKPDPKIENSHCKYIPCIKYVSHGGRQIAYHGHKLNPYYDETIADRWLNRYYK